MFEDYVESDEEVLVTEQGGKAYQVTELTQLRRFLIIGPEGGDAYQKEIQIASEHMQLVRRLYIDHGNDILDIVEQVSLSGLAKKQSATLAVLAAGCATEDRDVQNRALSLIPKVCRTTTMLFEFLTYVTEMRGWGPALRRGVGSWYNDKSLQSLMYQIVKYRKRAGWSHRDALWMAHPRPDSAERNQLYSWIMNPNSLGDVLPEHMAYINAYTEVNHFMTSVEKIITLIRLFELPWEAIPNQLLVNREVQTALAEHMQPMALIRKLSTFSITEGSELETTIAKKLENETLLQHAKVHPMAVLLALTAYKARQARGARLSQRITAALDKAFYATFASTPRIQGKTLIVIDVSDSMNTNKVENSYLPVMHAAAALALLFLNIAEETTLIGFDREVRFPTVNPNAPLSAITDIFSKYKGGGTHCSKPFQWLLDTGNYYDTILFLTDNVNGGEHVTTRLQKYRATVNPDVRLINVAMAVNQYTTIEPNDLNSLDIAGFDASSPVLISAFANRTF